jgi:SAM-dependent methyltransferase
MHSTRYYDNNAKQLVDHYDSMSADAVHGGWLGEHLPKTPGFACDIGAGSGRDANWLAGNGWDVIAVEPSREMRDLAQAQSHANVTWLDDALPGLEKLRRLGHRFDLVLLSAVWMHVPPTKRERAFRVVSELLKPSGVLVITLRHGSDEVENKERGFLQVSAGELMSFAKQRALAVTGRSSESDHSRSHVDWETIIFTMPDDGTGSLPLLRHVIVNDDKSSSYKLGLLRVLTRIAEGAPGVVSLRTHEYVEIPLGLVALYWLKQYKPLLLNHKIPQHPNTRQGYGFAGDDFYRLDQVSSYDLRIGAQFSSEFAPVIVGAIRDAAKNIVEMPAHYITYPGQNRPIFESARSSVRKTNKPITLSLEFLSSFGTFRIPANLWDTFGHYACWLEPAILQEWAGLTQGWGISEYRSADLSMFEWEEGRRDTSVAARRVDTLRAEGAPIACVWSATTPKKPQIDHCFPWSRWMNNDLWNLMPASAAVNLSKGDKLPSAFTMADAQVRIIDWWHRAYMDSPLRGRFIMEAGGSLPRLVEGEPELDDLYQAMLHQRARLKADQQLVEWTLR